jgi:hypothetical protein
VKPIIYKTKDWLAAAMRGRRMEAEIGTPSTNAIEYKSWAKTITLMSCDTELWQTE